MGASSLLIERSVNIHATVENTFQAVVNQIGRDNHTPEGQPMPMVVELRPGGRWYRDLGNEMGHLWGHVQAIKKPTLLEFTGPMFMSSAVVSNIQFRLESNLNETILEFRNSIYGLIPENVHEGLQAGWNCLLERIASSSGQC